MWYSTINSRAFGRWIASHAAILLGSFCGEDSLKAAEDYLDRSERVNGWKTRKAFESFYDDKRASVVEILEAGHQIALGTVVSSMGHIVTKASEFGEALEVRDHTGKRFVPSSIRVDASNDLAVIQIDGAEWQPLSWASPSKVDMGMWVISPHEDETQIRVGVISTLPREVTRKPGALGIKFSRFFRRQPSIPEDETSQGLRGARIDEVVDGSAADQAGLKAGDRITRVNERDVEASGDVIEAIQKYEAGEVITLTFQRGEESLVAKATLGFFDATFPDADLNITLSGDISKRRTGFQEILQHDMPLPPKAMGGPLMNLQGELVGINISRFERVATLALPLKLVQDFLEMDPDFPSLP